MTPQALFNALSGYKTYLVAAVAIAYLLYCKHAGQPPDETVLTILGSLGLAALRHGNKTDIASLFADAKLEDTSVPAPKPAGSLLPPGTAGFALRPLMLLLAGISLGLVLFTSGCGIFKAPPDRIAFTGVQFSDESLSTAYDSWVPDWQGRYDAAKAAGDSTATDALKKERTDVDKLVKAYQAAHKAILRTAEASIQSATNGVANIILDPTDTTKADLLHVLLHN